MNSQTIVKHSYIRREPESLDRAYAHLRYIAHRPEDEKAVSRLFYSEKEDGISRKRVAAAIEKASQKTNVIAHKLIISPGVSDIDMRSYVRDVMKEIGSSKGLDLDWYAVTHTNTEHLHSHVVVMPKDRWGRQVRFDRNDYQKMRTFGDRHLLRYRSFDKEKVKEKHGESQFSWFERLKANAKQIYQDLKALISKDVTEDSLPLGSNRKLNEGLAFGNIPSYSQILDRRNDRDERKKEKDWKKYIRPIQISYISSVEPVEFNPCTPIQSLRKLEIEYLKGDAVVVAQMKPRDYERLQQWIKSRYRFDKELDRKATEVKEIRFELSEEESISVESNSARKELERVRTLHMKSRIHLGDHEFRALSKWLANKKESP